MTRSHTETKAKLEAYWKWVNKNQQSIADDYMKKDGGVPDFIKQVAKKRAL